VGVVGGSARSDDPGRRTVVKNSAVNNVLWEGRDVGENSRQQTKEKRKAAEKKNLKGVGLYSNQQPEKKKNLDHCVERPNARPQSPHHQSKNGAGPSKEKNRSNEHKWGKTNRGEPPCGGGQWFCLGGGWSGKRKKKIRTGVVSTWGTPRNAKTKKKYKCGGWKLGGGWPPNKKSQTASKTGVDPQRQRDGERCSQKKSKLNIKWKKRWWPVPIPRIGSLGQRNEKRNK